MFTQQTVTNCPVTSGSTGRVIIPPILLAELVGTLDREEGEEWLVLLHGKREEGGLTYRVERITVPPEQKRDSSEVELPDMVEEPDLIGVLHSHHSMGAFFSGTDKTKLNPKYDLSIVISSRLEKDEHKVLGFSYEAEGGVKLPCGANGRIKFVIEPEDVKDWPFWITPGFKADPKFQGLGDCSKAEVEREGDTAFYEKVTTTPTCQLGLQPVIVKGPKIAAFGRGGDAISKLLPAPVSPVKWVQKESTGSQIIRDRERRYRQQDSENYYGNFYSSVEYDPGDIETRQQCCWCKSWELDRELIDCDGELFCDDCCEFLVEYQNYKDAPIVAAGFDPDIEWAGRKGDLEEKYWGGYYEG